MVLREHPRGIASVATSDRATGMQACLQGDKEVGRARGEEGGGEVERGWGGGGDLAILLNWNLGILMLGRAEADKK